MTVQIQVYSMTTTEKILRLTQYALIEIRYQARMPNGKIQDIELLSDLFHNVPFKY